MQQVFFELIAIKLAVALQLDKFNYGAILRHMSSQ